MNDTLTRLSDRLPYDTALPPDPAQRRRTKTFRVLAYGLLAVILLVPVVQFQVLAAKIVKKSGVAAENPEEKTKATRGALWRWREPVRLFWKGENIYQLPPSADANAPASEEGGGTYLHPNMPFTVMFLGLFTCLPPAAMMLVYNLLKVAIILGCILMAVRLADHDGRRMPGWVVFLGSLWAIQLIVGDIQHGNTNVLVMGGIVLHLWLYRRGHDVWAGVPLAFAICLKMIPAIFILYWLYQRNWRLLGGTIASLFVMAVAIPAAAMGPSHYLLLTRTWLDNLIVPGLLKAAWYPIHINQSLPAVLGRYLLDGRPGGDIFWNTDDCPNYAQLTRHGWIAFAALTEAQVKMIFRVAQVALLGLMALAIGWKKLPRDDGRRALHYGMVVAAMLLLNQRTWDHHAGVMLLATMAAWYGIGFLRVSTPVRATALAMVLVAGAGLWLTSQELIKFLATVQQLCAHWGDLHTYGSLGKFTAAMFKEGAKIGADWADYVAAYGRTFYYFLLTFFALVLLALAGRKQPDPYATERQKL